MTDAVILFWFLARVLRCAPSLLSRQGNQRRYFSLVLRVDIPLHVRQITLFDLERYKNVSSRTNRENQPLLLSWTPQTEDQNDL